MLRPGARHGLCFLSLVLLAPARAPAADSSHGRADHPRLTKPITLTANKPHNNPALHQHKNDNSKGELRNAIGAPVRPQDHERQDSAHPIVNRAPAINKNTAIVSPPKANDGAVHPTQLPPIGRPPGKAGPHEATVDGTKLIHPGSATSSIGGQTKYLAGVNGSALRHKP